MVRVLRILIKLKNETLYRPIQKRREEILLLKNITNIEYIHYIHRKSYRSIYKVFSRLNNFILYTAATIMYPSMLMQKQDLIVLG